MIRPTWETLFDREDLGFDLRTPEVAARDAGSLVRRVGGRPETLLSWVEQPGWSFWAWLLLLAAGVIGGLVAERSRPARWRRFWIYARRPMASSRVWQAASRVLERAAVPVLALAFWVVATALGGLEATPAARFVEWLLLTWLGYRSADAAVRQVAVRLRPVPQVQRLYRAIHAVLLFAAFWLMGWMALDTGGARPEIVSLWVAGGHLALVLAVFAVLADRSRVLALLPESDERALTALRAGLQAIYYPALTGSLALGLLWVLGYRNLAGVVLGRSWAVLGVIALAYAVYHGIVSTLKRSGKVEPEQAETRIAAVNAAARLIGLIVFLLAFRSSIGVLGLREPLRELFAIPWVEIGSVSITGRAVWISLISVLLAFRFSLWLQAALAYRVYPRVSIGPGEAYALNRLLHYALLVGMVLLVLNVLGIPPQNLALVVGGLSVGIGFGLQEIARNVASGIVLLVGRQVRKGDVISVADRMGTVQAVNLRATVVSTFDNVDLIIPNSKLLDDTVINWTHSGSLIRTKLTFGVAYGSGIQAVKEIALRAATRHPDVAATPAPEIWLTELGDSALRFELMVWVDMLRASRPVVVSDLYAEILQEFAKAGIEIPFPQRELHLRSGSWERVPDGRERELPPTDGEDVKRN